MRIARQVLAFAVLFSIAAAPQLAKCLLQSSAATGITTDWANCLACHTMPGTNLPKLADLRPTNLGVDLPVKCSSCHSELQLLKPASAWQHPTQPLALHLPCTDCHVTTPHDKDHPPPLPVGDYNAKGCYKCHADVRAERRMLSSHGEQQALRCRDCHPPHTPLMVGLPAQFVPQQARRGWYTAYDWQSSNAGCLACHPSGQLMYGLTQGFVTLNTENYHARHVQSGRVLCIECHTQHGTFTSKLLRSRLLTGEALTFFERADGGLCNLQCHSIVHKDWEYINNVY